MMQIKIFIYIVIYIDKKLKLLKSNLIKLNIIINYLAYPKGHGTFFEHWQVVGSWQICGVLAEHSKNGFPT
jgi:hypothetical protein